MAAFTLFGRKKKRKYPIKRDERGKSARARCFEMFANQTPLNEVAEDSWREDRDYLPVPLAMEEEPGFRPPVYLY